MRQGDLDPEDWSAFETQVNRVLQAAVQKLRSAHEGRVWTPPSEELIAQLSEPVPTGSMDLTDLATRLETLLPYGVGNTHPRFFGWVHGAGSPGNLLAEIVGAAMNANCGGRDHIAIYIERQVIDWCKSLFGFPVEASGLVVSGTSMGTIIAAKTARDAAMDYASRADGMRGSNLVGYVSEQAHSCLARAFDMIGLGTRALRKTPVTADYEIDLGVLEAQIQQDRADGFRPFFVAGTIGTVNTGAIDNLAALADLATREQIWFHVDGAFGANAMTSPEIAPRLKGLERADSLAFDFHKWMHVNYDAGCVLVRDGAAHRKAFANRPDYLAANGTALAAGEPWPVDYGPELSRGFRALKVWAHLLEHGTDKIGRSIARNCELAKYLEDQIEERSEFERLAPVSLNICCFRFLAPGQSVTQLDDLNSRLVAWVQNEGIAAPSTTRLNGRVAIRVNITNHRTQKADIDILLDALARGGAELSRD